MNEKNQFDDLRDRYLFRKNEIAPIRTSISGIAPGSLSTTIFITINAKPTTNISIGNSANGDLRVV
jgi:hypothetical protein